jgi:hypothetical protein
MMTESALTKNPRRHCAAGVYGLSRLARAVVPSSEQTRGVDDAGGQDREFAPATERERDDRWVDLPRLGYV